MDSCSLKLLDKIVKDCDPSSIIASAFHGIINELKGSHVLWDDFIKQASKLHSCLKATLLAIASYLDAFQKIADSASGAKGATRDIGTAMTRICLRHRAVEARLKTFTSALAECMIAPVVEKMDEWKRKVSSLDQKHSKEYKRYRSDLKKRSAEVIRMYKKSRKVKGTDMQHSINGQIADIKLKYQRFEDNECSLLSSAMVEERSHYCHLVICLKPVVQGETAVAEELNRLTEVMTQLDSHAVDPYTLPSSSEQVIVDMRYDAASSRWTDGADSVLGSRRPSLLSVHSTPDSSVTAAPESVCPSSTGSVAATDNVTGVSPAAGLHDDGSTVRVSSVTSHDSGFTSSHDGGGAALFAHPAPPTAAVVPAAIVTSSSPDDSTGSSSSDCTPPSSTQQLQQPPQSGAAVAERRHSERPHTISAAYERGGDGVRHRPSLGTLTFMNPRCRFSTAGADDAGPAGHTGSAGSRSRPAATAKLRTNIASHYSQPAPVKLPDFNQTVSDMVVPQPIYANTADLRQRRPVEQERQMEYQRCESEGSASSSGYGSVQLPLGQIVLNDVLPPPPDFVLNNIFSCSLDEDVVCPLPPPDRRPERPPLQHRYSYASSRTSVTSLRRCVSQTATGGAGGRGVSRPPPPLPPVRTGPQSASVSPVLLRRDPRFLQSLSRQLYRRASSSASTGQHGQSQEEEHSMFEQMP